MKIIVALILSFLCLHGRLCAGEIVFSVPRCQLSDDDREVIAACLVLEAANQGAYGMAAVMSVIVNRSSDRPELFPVVVRRPGHFSALNVGTRKPWLMPNLLNRAKRSPVWSVAWGLVDEAVRGELKDLTGGATHYLRRGSRAVWRREVEPTCVIGDHEFFRSDYGQ